MLFKYILFVSLILSLLAVKKHYKILQLTEWMLWYSVLLKLCENDLLKTTFISDSGLETLQSSSPKGIGAKLCFLMQNRYFASLLSSKTRKKMIQKSSKFRINLNISKIRHYILSVWCFRIEHKIKQSEFRLQSNFIIEPF